MEGQTSMLLCSRSRRAAAGRRRWQIAGRRKQGIGSNCACTYETVSVGIRIDIDVLHSGICINMTAQRAHVTWPYLFPSLLMLLPGTSNKQFGQ